MSQRLNRLVLIAAVAVVLGLGLRFSGLERKVFWDDEIYSAFRIYGYTEQQVNRLASEATTAGDLRAILEPRALSGSPAQTVSTLASEEPQHAPPFFLLERWWVGMLGATIFNMRALTALLSLLALPAMYWLCYELFGSKAAAVIGVALVALSPVQIVYEQEVREYGLWSTALLLMTAALVRATRIWTPGSWALYGASFLGALYVYPLTLVVAAVQLAFVFVVNRAAPRRLLMPLLAAAAAVACFVPWLLLILHGLPQIDKSMEVILVQKSPVSETLRRLTALVRLNFVDFDLSHATALNALLSLGTVALIGYALYVLCKGTKLAVWGLLVASMVAALVPTVLPDLLGTGARTSQTRYFIPFFLAVDAAVAYLFYVKLSAKRSTALWTLLLVGVLCGRLATDVASARAQTWWSKFNEQSIALASAIDAQPRPLLVSDSYAVWALSVGEYLRPDDAVLLRPNCYLCDAPPSPPPPLPPHAGFDVFLLGPSPALLTEYRSTAFRCIDVRSNCTSNLTLW